MNLSEFLLARIAEDEAEAAKVQARVAESGASGLGTEVWIVTGMDDATGVDYHPARVLAECEAKRRIVTDGHTRTEYAGYDPVCGECGSGEPYEYPVAWPCSTLRLLALPYSDHPDYRDEWRP